MPTKPKLKAHQLPSAIKELKNRFSIDLAQLLITKQSESNEPLHLWLYRYVYLRVHFVSLVIYLFLLARFDLIICWFNSQIRNRFQEKLCLLNSTFANRIVVTEGHSVLDNLLPKLDYSEHPQEKHDYYVHIIMIVFAQYLINLMHNCVYYLCKSMRQRHFRYPSFRSDYNTSEREYIHMLYSIKHCLSSRVIQLNFLVSHFLAELIPLVAIGATVLLLNVFFNHEFISLGVEVILHMFKSDCYWLALIRHNFPIETSCTIQMGASTGSPYVVNGKCLLPFNFVNQIVFTFWWFAYAFLVGFLILSLYLRVIYSIVYTIKRVCVRQFKTKTGEQESGCESLRIGGASLVEMILVNNATEFSRHQNVGPDMKRLIKTKLFEQFINFDDSQWKKTVLTENIVNWTLMPQKVPKRSQRNPKNISKEVQLGADGYVKLADNNNENNDDEHLYEEIDECVARHKVAINHDYQVINKGRKNDQNQPNS